MRKAKKTQKPMNPDELRDWCKNQLLTNKRYERDCWIWLGKSNQGYGVLYVPKIGNILVHRLAMYILRPKEFTLEMLANRSFNCQVNHHCDVKRCFNPDHLYIGTHASNMRDAVVRRRTLKDIFPPRIEI